MAILAIDPSLSSTGVALLEPGPHWSVATIKSSATSNPDAHSAALRRMEGIGMRLNDWVFEQRAEIKLSVIEAPAFSRGTGSAHERAGLWWRLYALLTSYGAPVLVVLPNLRAKYATGKGTAGKDEVLLAVSRRYQDAPVTNNNEADAVVLAAMGARWDGYAIDSVPKANVDAMKTLVTP